MPFGVGPTEIIIIILIVVLIVGIGKLPQAGAALGKTMKAFKTGRFDEEEHQEEKTRHCSKPVKKIAKK